MSNDRLVFNPSDIPVLNEDNDQQIDGQGWSCADVDGEWAQKAVADGRLIVAPETLSTSSADNINPDVYRVLQKMEEDGYVAETPPDPGPEPEVEEPVVPEGATQRKGSKRRTASVGDTGSDATESGAAKTGSTKE